MSYARPRGGGFARLAAPVVGYAISDDPFPPVASVEALLRFYARALTDRGARVIPGACGCAPRTSR